MKAIIIVKKTAKYIGIAIAGLFLLVLLIYVFASIKTVVSRHKTYQVDNVMISIPEDSASIARGAHLYSVYACRDCHGDNLEGRVMMEDPAVGRFVTTNLTKGKGGLPSDYSDQDWLKALKHGINQKGNPLIGMPSNESTLIPDEDLAALIAFCKSQPPVDNELKEIKIGPLIKILTAFGQVDLFSAEKIDHRLKPVLKPEEKVSVDFGETLAINCIGCHGTDFAGGPSAVPDHPPVPDISSTGRVGKWTEEEFMATLRMGKTPDGHQFDNNVMPWIRFREFSDVELKALRQFLLSYPRSGSSAALSAN